MEKILEEKSEGMFDCPEMVSEARHEALGRTLNLEDRELPCEECGEAEDSDQQAVRDMAWNNHLDYDNDYREAHMTHSIMNFSHGSPTHEKQLQPQAKDSLSFGVSSLVTKMKYHKELLRHRCGGLRDSQQDQVSIDDGNLHQFLIKPEINQHAQYEFTGNKKLRRTKQASSVCEDQESWSSPTPLFHKFLGFPTEVRERIYAIALGSDKPIRPHLCEANPSNPKEIQFHDDSQMEHNATFKRIAITFVSRQVRNESLSVFYGANVFDTVADTLSYFTRLENLGRFHMIRHVTFTVDFKNDFLAPKALRDILQNISEQERYEAKIVALNLQRQWEDNKPENVEREKQAAFIHNILQEFSQHGREGRQPFVALHDSYPLYKTTATEQEGAVEENTGPLATMDIFPKLTEYKPDLTRFYTNKHNVLKNHPQHLVGGLPWINTFLVLRKLASDFTFTSTTGVMEYSQKLVLSVPRAQIFTDYENLTYFPSIFEGLGIKLHFVEGCEANGRDWGVGLYWHQRFQKKDFRAEAGGNGIIESGDGKQHHLESMSKRVRNMFPEVDKMRRPEVNTYYRKGCRSEEIQWFSIYTCGGGMT